MEELSFAQRLSLLLELHFELANTKSIDEICRTAIEMGRDATGIERLSIWFLDEGNPGWCQGTFGIDENGALRDERQSRIPLNEEIYDREFMERRVPFKLLVHTNAYDDTGTVVGKADHVVAPMWDGVHSIGVLSADTCLSGKRIREEECELVAILARMAGYAVAIKRKEEMLKADARELERLATTDDLTGILNRRTGMQFLEHQLSVARRTHRPLTVFFIDLDGLKTVNDTTGHHAGDLFITTMATLITQAVRDSDIVCRMGGDEFMAVLPMSTAAECGIVLERLARLTRTSEVLKQFALDRWYSVGVATWNPADSVSTTGKTNEETTEIIAQHLVNTADSRMYAQKRAHETTR